MTVIQAAPGQPHLTYKITWEKLPDDYRLPDDPVENISQPLLAYALRECLELIGWLDLSSEAGSTQRLVASNLGVCVTVNGKTIVKAPDWFMRLKSAQWRHPKRAAATRLRWMVPFRRS